MALKAITPQPPPLPRPAKNGPSNVIAAISGAVAYLTVIYRFQTYTQRNNMPVGTYELFAAVMFLFGFLVGLFASTSWARAATFLIVGMCAAHAIIIAVDLHEGPTTHNLLPFEFVYFFVLGCPAYLGAWLSRFAKRPRYS